MKMIDITHKDIKESNEIEIDGIEFVKVVRCKDCKHNQVWTWNHGIRDNPRCNFTNYVRSNEFFCGFGERRSE